MVKPHTGTVWISAKTLYAKARPCTKVLGPYVYVRSQGLPCSLVVVKRPARGRHKCSLRGMLVRSSRSLKQSRAQREPWLLAVCAHLSALSADAVVALHAKRMQIEQAFRDLKNKRLGLGLYASRSRYAPRWTVLVLIAHLALFVLRLIGEASQCSSLEHQFHGAARYTILSVIRLGREVVKKRLADFSFRQLNPALWRLQCQAQCALI